MQPDDLSKTFVHGAAKEVLSNGVMGFTQHSPLYVGQKLYSLIAKVSQQILAIMAQNIQNNESPICCANLY